MAVFVYEALTERASQGRRVANPTLLAILAVSLVGILDESIQAIVPNREFELQDIRFNVLAGVRGVLAQ